MNLITTQQKEQTIYKPIFGIDRIDAPYLTLFYVMVWMLMPPLYNRRVSKSMNRTVVSRYVKEFRTRASFAGILVGRGAALQFVFSHLQRSLEKSLPEHDRARALMARYLNSQFTEGVDQ